MNRPLTVQVATVFQSREVVSAVATILTSGGNGTRLHALVGTLTSHALVMDTHIMPNAALQVVLPVQRENSLSVRRSGFMRS